MLKGKELSLTDLSDDLLLDNFHWSKVSDKEYDLFRAELVRRLNPNPSPSESRFNEIDQKLEKILGQISQTLIP